MCVGEKSCENNFSLSSVSFQCRWLKESFCKDELFEQQDKQLSFFLSFLSSVDGFFFLHFIFILFVKFSLILS